MKRTILLNKEEICQAIREFVEANVMMDWREDITIRLITRTSPVATVEAEITTATDEEFPGVEYNK